MKRTATPEPQRSEIVRRMQALPERDDDPTGWVLVWAALFALVWIAAGIIAVAYLLREGPLT